MGGTGGQPQISSYNSSQQPTLNPYGNTNPYIRGGVTDQVNAMQGRPQYASAGTRAADGLSQLFSQLQGRQGAPGGFDGMRQNLIPPGGQGKGGPSSNGYGAFEPPTGNGGFAGGRAPFSAGGAGHANLPMANRSPQDQFAQQIMQVIQGGNTGGGRFPGADQGAAQQGKGGPGQGKGGAAPAQGGMYNQWGQPSFNNMQGSQK